MSSDERHRTCLSTGDETGSVAPQAKKSLFSAVVRVPGKAVYGDAAGFKAQWSRAKLALTVASKRSYTVAAYVASTGWGG